MAKSPDKKEERIKARYIGDGSANPSTIPARDLTEEDWDALSEEQQESVRAAPQLYEMDPAGKG